METGRHARPGQAGDLRAGSGGAGDLCGACGASLRDLGFLCRCCLKDSGGKNLQLVLLPLRDFLPLRNGRNGYA